MENESACGIGPIEYDEPDFNTPLEFVKPPGTGTNLWPPSTSEYPYTDTCTKRDQFLSWWQEPDNLNAFAHVSRKWVGSVHSIFRSSQTNSN